MTLFIGDFLDERDVSKSPTKVEIDDGIAFIIQDEDAIILSLEALPKLMSLLDEAYQHRTKDRDNG